MSGRLDSQRVMVTGGAGFLGRFVVEALERRGARPAVVRSAEHDLRTEMGCREALREHDPEVVIHLAASVGGIGANRSHPGTFFRDNAFMGMHLVEACRLLEVPKLVVAGTVCAYPKTPSLPFREDALWDGYPEETNAPYGIAKKALLVMLDAYHREFGMSSAFLLPANLYGPGDNFDLESSHVIPAMVRKMIEARDAGASEVVLWGDGSPSREFLHVRDCAEGLCLAAERLDEPVPVNLGTGREVRMKELAELIRAATRFEGELVWDTDQPNGQPRRVLDTSRARELLGFEARTPLEEGLAELVAWYRSERESAP
jgi:GDP-L-fucose synthase